MDAVNAHVSLVFAPAHFRCPVGCLTGTLVSAIPWAFPIEHCPPSVFFLYYNVYSKNNVDPSIQYIVATSLIFFTHCVLAVHIHFLPVQGVLFEDAAHALSCDEFFRHTLKALFKLCTVFFRKL